MAKQSDPKDLAAFVDRDWGRVRASKEAYWAQTTRERGPLQGLRAGAALWEHARSGDPSWPDERTRQADLEHHIRMCALLRRLEHVFTRR